MVAYPTTQYPAYMPKDGLFDKTVVMVRLLRAVAVKPKRHNLYQSINTEKIVIKKAEKSLTVQPPTRAIGQLGAHESSHQG